MSPEQTRIKLRRSEVSGAFRDCPEASDEAIAAGLGVSPMTVSGDRRALGIPSGVVRRRKMRGAL